MNDAVVIREAGALVWEPFELPEPGPHEAVVRVLRGGICGSDLHYYRDGRVGESILREPLVLGHEIVGIVETAAQDGSGPEVGTQVFVHPAEVCGACPPCVGARPNLCEELRYMGSAAKYPHCQGGFRALVAVPASRLFDATGILPRDAALIEPAAVAWHALARVQDLGRSLEDDVAVVGCGPIGLLTLAAVLAQVPAARVTAVDLLDAPLERARVLGADATHRAQQAAEPLSRLAPQVVFETSGSRSGLDLALQSVRPGGTVVAVGQLPPDIALPFQLVVGREIVVSGSSRFGTEAAAVIAAIRSGALRLEGVVTHEFPAAQCLEAFAVAADAARSGKVLLDFQA